MQPSKLVCAFIISSVAGLGFAAPALVGTWTGRVHVIASANATPEQKQGVNAYLTTAQKMRSTLVLKVDHSFVMDSTDGSHSTHKTGKWTLKGNSLSLLGAKIPRVLKLEPNGKSMSYDAVQPGFTVEIKFTR